VQTKLLEDILFELKVITGFLMILIGTVAIEQRPIFGFSMVFVGGGNVAVAVFGKPRTVKLPPTEEEKPGVPTDGTS